MNLLKNKDKYTAMQLGSTVSVMRPGFSTGNVDVFYTHKYACSPSAPHTRPTTFCGIQHSHTTRTATTTL